MSKQLIDNSNFENQEEQTSPESFFVTPDLLTFQTSQFYLKHSNKVSENELQNLFNTVQKSRRLDDIVRIIQDNNFVVGIAQQIANIQAQNIDGLLPQKIYLFLNRSLVIIGAEITQQKQYLLNAFEILLFLTCIYIQIYERKYSLMNIESKKDKTNQRISIANQWESQKCSLLNQLSIRYPSAEDYFDASRLIRLAQCLQMTIAECLRWNWNLSYTSNVSSASLLSGETIQGLSKRPIGGTGELTLSDQVGGASLFLKRLLRQLFESAICHIMSLNFFWQMIRVPYSHNEIAVSSNSLPSAQVLQEKQFQFFASFFTDLFNTGLHKPSFWIMNACLNIIAAANQKFTKKIIEKENKDDGRKNSTISNNPLPVAEMKFVELMTMYNPILLKVCFREILMCIPALANSLNNSDLDKQHSIFNYQLLPSFHIYNYSVPSRVPITKFVIDMIGSLISQKALIKDMNVGNSGIKSSQIGDGWTCSCTLDWEKEENEDSITDSKQDNYQEIQIKESENQMEMDNINNQKEKSLYISQENEQLNIQLLSNEKYCSESEKKMVQMKRFISNLIIKQQIDLSTQLIILNNKANHNEKKINNFEIDTQNIEHLFCNILTSKLQLRMNELLNVCTQQQIQQMLENKKQNQEISGQSSFNSHNRNTNLVSKTTKPFFIPRRFSCLLLVLTCFLHDRDSHVRIRAAGWILRLITGQPIEKQQIIRTTAEFEQRDEQQTQLQSSSSNLSVQKLSLRSSDTFLLCHAHVFLRCVSHLLVPTSFSSIKTQQSYSFSQQVTQSHSQNLAIISSTATEKLYALRILHALLIANPFHSHIDVKCAKLSLARVCEQRAAFDVVEHILKTAWNSVEQHFLSDSRRRELNQKVSNGKFNINELASGCNEEQKNEQYQQYYDLLQDINDCQSQQKYQSFQEWINDSLQHPFVTGIQSTQCNSQQNISVQFQTAVPVDEAVIRVIFVSLNLLHGKIPSSSILHNLLQQHFTSNSVSIVRPTQLLDFTQRPLIQQRFHHIRVHSHFIFTLHHFIFPLIYSILFQSIPSSSKFSYNQYPSSLGAVQEMIKLIIFNRDNDLIWKASRANLINTFSPGIQSATGISADIRSFAAALLSAQSQLPHMHKIKDFNKKKLKKERNDNLNKKQIKQKIKNKRKEIENNNNDYEEEDYSSEYKESKFETSDSSSEEDIQKGMCYNGQKKQISEQKYDSNKYQQQDQIQDEISTNISLHTLRLDSFELSNALQLHITASSQFSQSAQSSQSLVGSILKARLMCLNSPQQTAVNIAISSECILSKHKLSVIQQVINQILDLTKQTNMFKLTDQQNSPLSIFTASVIGHLVAIACAPALKHVNNNEHCKEQSILNIIEPYSSLTSNCPLDICNAEDGSVLQNITNQSDATSLRLLTPAQLMHGAWVALRGVLNPITLPTFFLNNKGIFECIKDNNIKEHILMKMPNSNIGRVIQMIDLLTTFSGQNETKNNNNELNLNNSQYNMDEQSQTLLHLIAPIFLPITLQFIRELLENASLEDRLLQISKNRKKIIIDKNNNQNNFMQKQVNMKNMDVINDNDNNMIDNQLLQNNLNNLHVSLLGTGIHNQIDNNNVNQHSNILLPKNHNQDYHEQNQPKILYLVLSSFVSLYLENHAVNLLLLQSGTNIISSNENELDSQSQLQLHQQISYFQIMDLIFALQFPQSTAAHILQTINYQMQYDISKLIVIETHNYQSKIMFEDEQVLILKNEQQFHENQEEQKSSMIKSLDLSQPLCLQSQSLFSNELNHNTEYYQLLRHLFCTLNAFMSFIFDLVQHLSLQASNEGDKAISEQLHQSNEKKNQNRTNHQNEMIKDNIPEEQDFKQLKIGNDEIKYELDNEEIGASYMHMHNEQDFLLRCVKSAMEDVIANGWIGRKLIPWIQSAFHTPIQQEQDIKDFQNSTNYDNNQNQLFQFDIHSQVLIQNYALSLISSFINSCPNFAKKTIIMVKNKINQQINKIIKNVLDMKSSQLSFLQYYHINNLIILSGELFLSAPNEAHSLISDLSSLLHYPLRNLAPINSNPQNILCTTMEDHLRENKKIEENILEMTKMHDQNQLDLFPFVAQKRIREPTFIIISTLLLHGLLKGVDPILALSRALLPSFSRNNQSSSPQQSILQQSTQPFAVILKQPLHTNQFKLGLNKSVGCQTYKQSNGLTSSNKSFMHLEHLAEKFFALLFVHSSKDYGKEKKDKLFGRKNTKRGQKEKHEDNIMVNEANAEDQILISQLSDKQIPKQNGDTLVVQQLSKPLSAISLQTSVIFDVFIHGCRRQHINDNVPIEMDNICREEDDEIHERMYIIDHLWDCMEKSQKKEQELSLLFSEYLLNLSSSAHSISLQSLVSSETPIKSTALFNNHSQSLILQITTFLSRLTPSSDSLLLLLNAIRRGLLSSVLVARSATEHKAMKEQIKKALLIHAKMFEGNIPAQTANIQIGQKANAKKGKKQNQIQDGKTSLATLFALELAK